MVIAMALMLAFSIAFAVGAIYGNNTAPSDHWAKQDIRYVLLSKICGFATRTVPSGFWAKRNLGQVLLTAICGLAIRAAGTTTATVGAALVATSGISWSAKDRQPGRWLVRNERIRRKATGSHRVIMARWSVRRRFKPVAKVLVQADLRMWVSAGPNRKVRRQRANVRALFLSKLAIKRAEEREESLAVEAALAAEAAKAEARALARAAVKAEAREGWLAARAARRTEAGRTGKLGAVTEGVKLSVRKYRNSEAIVKTNPQDSANGKVIQRPFKGGRKQKVVDTQPPRSWYSWALENARVSPEVALQLNAELSRCARLERAYGVVGLMADEAVYYQAQVRAWAIEERQVRAVQKAARLAARQARQAARAAEREEKDWVRWQRDAVKMGHACPIVTKRPAGQGMVAHATILPVLAEYLGFGLDMAIIGILAAVAITAFLKFITKSKINEAGLKPVVEDTTDTVNPDPDVVDDTDTQTDADTTTSDADTVSDVSDVEPDADDTDTQTDVADPDVTGSAGSVSYATMHDLAEYYSELREQIQWAQAKANNGKVDFYEDYEPSEEDFLRWKREEQAVLMQEAAYLAFSKGQSSLALVLPVLTSFMDLGLGFIVAAVVIGLSEEYRAIIGKICDLARNKPVYPNDGPQVGPRPRPPVLRDNENWEADSRAYNEAYAAWLVQEAAGAEHFRNWQDQVRDEHKKQIEDAIFSIPEIQLLDPRDVVLMCQTIDSNCNLEEKLEAFTSWVIESVEVGHETIMTHRNHWQEYVQLCSEVGEKPDARYQEYKILYGRSYTTTVALASEIDKFKVQVLNRETEKATEVAKAPEVAEAVTLVVPEPAKPEKVISSAKVDLKTANLSGLFGGAIRSNKANAFALPILAPVLGLDVDPLLVVAMVAMTWLISKVSPSFGGFALTLLAGAFGYAAATVTGQEANSLPEEGQQGNQPHTDQEGLMVEENQEVVNDRATELLGTTKGDFIGSLRTKKRASLYAELAKAAATSMVKVLLGEGVDLEKTSEGMFSWPLLKHEYRKAAYRAHLDSMHPDAAKAQKRELQLKEKYGISLFGDAASLEDYKHSLHHIHRTPGSAATIDMYDIVERGLKSLAEHNDLRAVTIGELAKAWVTLNLIQTNFASEVIALSPENPFSPYLMVNALSKRSFASVQVEYLEYQEKEIRGTGGDGITACPTDIFLLYRNGQRLTSEAPYNGFDVGSMAYRVRKFTSASKAAKAQKYISQYFAPNLLGGQVVDFNTEHTVKGYTFTLKSVKDSVLIVKPVVGDSVLGKDMSKMLADKVYDGVVFVSRRFMALVLPGHVDEIKAGKLDGKVLIGRAYGSDFLIKGGFVIMPPQFMKITGKDMIAYGSKNEICPTWSEDRLTVIINSGVPKTDKGACTDTQTLINGFNLRDQNVQRIFTQIKDDAIEWLNLKLEAIRTGKVRMAELDNDILDVMGMDDEDKASDEVLASLKDSSRLKEVIDALAYVTGSGMALPHVVAPTMNQLTNQAVDPGRTRLPLAMKLQNAKGEYEYCKIAISVYPQVHPGLMMLAIAQAMGIKLNKATLALFNGYKNPMTEDSLKELKEEHLSPYGLTYDPNRNIYCNPADYKKHVERHGSRLVCFFRNPSTFTSGAWGQLVPMDCVPVGCYWVNPTPEAFEWFFANQDGGDLDDRMVMLLGELAISCILYHEEQKKALIQSKIEPFKDRANPKTKAARAFIKAQTKFMLRDDMNVSMDAKVKLGTKQEVMVRDLTGDAAASIMKDMVTNRPLEIGTYSFKETMKHMSQAKEAFQANRQVDFGSALANVDSTISALELMNGTTGTAANVQMLMGAITQGLVDFGPGIDLDQKVKVISTGGQNQLEKELSPEELAELGNLTYRDLTFLVKSEMLSNVIDADTQGQNVPEAAEVMEMIWGVSMYLGIALFSEGKPKVEQKEKGTYVTLNMISLERMKFYFPGWLMKRGIGALAAPFAGQSHMLQYGESAEGKKVNLRHFAFEHTHLDTANGWVFDIFEDYMDQVLSLAHELVIGTFNDGDAPMWHALELGLQPFADQVAKVRSECNKLNKLRQNGIAAIHRLGLEPKRRRVALAAAEQAWLATWHSTLPTQEAKLMFAIWTLSNLVASANAKKNDLPFADRDSFVMSSRRSYGSVTIKDLSTHTLYVGNLLDADGEAVTCEQGFPQGPWLYSLKALNEMAKAPAIASVDVFFSFNEEYKELRDWIMGIVNGKPGFAIEAKPCADLKALMTTRDEFGVHTLDAELHRDLRSGVVGKTLADVLQSGLLNAGEGKFAGKLNISKKLTTLINKKYSSWRDSSTTKEDVKVFIEANSLHDYVVTEIEVVVETKAMGRQYAYPSFTLSLEYVGPERALQGFDLSTYVEGLSSKGAQVVDYSSGPIGHHTDVDFDGYDLDEIEDVVVEDFTHSEVIEAEPEVKVEPEMEVPAYRHPFMDRDPNLVLAYRYHEKKESVLFMKEELGFSVWAELPDATTTIEGSRVFNKSAMLVINSVEALRELFRVHTEYCLDVKSLQTREDFIDQLLDDADFFAYLKEKGYTGLYFEDVYFDAQPDMDQELMDLLPHYFSEANLVWFYGDSNGDGCHCYRYQLAFDFSTTTDPKPGPAEIKVEAEPEVEPEAKPEVAAAESKVEANVPENCEVLMYQGRNGESDSRKFQYWTQCKVEAADYGSVVSSRMIDLTGMLIKRSENGKAVYDRLTKEHRAETGESFDLLSPGKNSNLFFTRVKAAGYSGISFLGGDDNRYVVTFNGNADSDSQPQTLQSHHEQRVISETDNFKSKDFEFMSNMYPCPVVVDGVVFASSETLYQWIKCNILNREENTILPTDAGYTAKQKAKGFKPSSPDAMATWEALRLDVMYCILESKFTKNIDTPVGMRLAFRLYAATSGGTITPVENNYWGDTFWGECKGQGENHLGQLLRQVANLPKVKVAAKEYAKKFLRK